LKNNNDNKNEYQNIYEKWSIEEDIFLKNWNNLMGDKNWSQCAKLLKKRTAKDCKQRFSKALSPESPNEKLRFIWGPREELMLLLFVKNFGTCWSKIIKMFESQIIFNDAAATQENQEEKENDNILNLFRIKDANEIKNKFYSIIKRFVHLDLQEKSQNYQHLRKKQCYNRTNKIINYDSDDSFTLQGKENTCINIIDSCNEPEIQFESLWFYIDKAILFYRNYFVHYAYEEIIEIFTRITKDFQKEVDKCISEFNSKLNETAIGPSCVAENDCVKINLCQSCSGFLRSHIKKKIIIKYKQAKLSNPQIPEIKDFYGKEENIVCKNREADLDNMLKLIEKIPKIYGLIEEIKQRFAFS